MPSPSSDTKAAIIDAAIRLMRRQGFEQTSLREIAEEVGITKASLYYHFPSKLALLEAILDPVVVEFRDVAAQLAGLTRDRVGVERLMRRYLQGLVRHREIGSLVATDPSVLNALAERAGELVETGNRVQRWLAGPEPSNADLLRARCALAAAGVALSAGEVAPDAGEDEVVDELLQVINELLRL
ncbi:TetR/AcrR family transcriptional regulator [Enemella evansiae]|uniref:TetR/AcrR family transcriptional regulator n=1 Tax=Enemella evansiae TaxID=2016499 RepID=UPI000B97B39E|nr:TetR/AcrR family transcriptional regulator [Enemella evansiae]OYO01785.1 TetR family transcriptional regulator [Enemella evansiae]